MEENKEFQAQQKGLLKVIHFLREKADRGKLIVFVGAGVSCNVEGMPSWNKLVNKMADTLEGNEDKETTSEDERTFSIDDSLKFPQYLWNEDTEEYKNILNNSIPDLEIDPPLSSAIFDLNPTHIITTNYDHLLEKSSNPLRTLYQVIIRDKDLLTYTHSKYLIKMHGDIDDFDSIVLKEDDYLNYSSTHNLIEWFVRSLFTNHVVLFLGYSLNDSNVRQIVSWINLIRSENQITHKDSQPIGYLVQDEETIDRLKLNDFARKNIEIINIHSISSISDIPKELKDERGQRLYSFLKLIAEPSLEKNYFPIYEDSIRFMNQFNFISCQQILEILHLNIKSKLNFRDYTLKLWNENDYQRLSLFMDKDSDESTTLKQLFINAGVEKIVHSRLENETPLKEVISLGKVIEENKLFNNGIYQKYLFNQYEEIKNLLDQTPQIFTPIERCFYQSIISTDGYPQELVSEWEKPLKQIIDRKTLPLDEKVAYMHNSATFNYLGPLIDYKKDNFSINFEKVIQFIESLPLRQQRILFSQYLNIYQGNTQKKLEISQDLEKFKDWVQHEIFSSSGSSLTEFYRLKHLALTEYFFYFNNHILFRFFRNLNQILNPYIEAIIGLNSPNTNPKEMQESPWSYSLIMVDLDIITKFSVPEELNNLVKTYKTTLLKIESTALQDFIMSFQNLCHYLVLNPTPLESRNVFFDVFSNMLLILNLVSLSEEQKKEVKKSLEEFFGNELMLSNFFSIGWPACKYCLEELLKLSHSIEFSLHFEWIEKLVPTVEFYKYSDMVNFESLRRLIKSSLAQDSQIILQRAKIEKIIDNWKDSKEEIPELCGKVALLRLFYSDLKESSNVEKYRNYLSDHLNDPLAVNKLSDYIVVDLFNQGFIPTEKGLEGLMNQALKPKLDSDGFFYPLFATRLNLIYGFYLNGVLTDLSPLKELADKNPFLDFLLAPDKFDFSKADFSDSLWEMVIDHPKYIKYFIAHKNEILTNLEHKSKDRKLKEWEQNLYHGLLFSRETLINF